MELLTTHKRSNSILVWSDLTFGWSELTYGDLTMERSDRNSLN